MKYIFLSIIFIASCATDQNWLKIPPLTVKNDSGAYTIDFCVPSKKFIKSNVGNLEDKEFVELNYKLIDGECSQHFPDRKPYLFRSIIINEYGAYSVSGGRDYLWIDHATLAKLDTTGKKSAVIVFLKTVPQNIYITYHHDE